MLRPRVSFTHLLSWCFGLLMLIGLGLVLYLGFNSARINARALLADRSHLLMDMVVTQIDSQLQPVEQQLHYLAGSLANPDFQRQDMEVVRLLLEGALAATPQVMGLMLFKPDLSRTWVNRDQPRAAINAWYQQRLPVLLPYIEQPPDKPLWLSPRWSPRLQQLVLPLIYPVYHEQRFLGLLVAVIRVDRLSEFVARLSEQLQVKLFVLHGRDQVLAYPGMYPNQVAALDDENPLPTLAQTGDLALQQLWNPDRQRQDWLERSDIEALSLTTGQQRYLYLVRQLEGYGEQPWIVGAYLTAEQVPQEIQRLWRVLAVGLLLMGVLLLLVVWISRRLGAELDQTVSGFDAIGQQPLLQIPYLAGSPIKELDRLSEAYNRMLDELRQSEASQRLFGQYVPQAIARELLSHHGQLQPRSCEATVLFCDLEGFTRLSQQLGPDRLVTLLNQYFSVVVAVIEAHNGVVTQFQGDALLATFNVPLADPDHALQAWRAALQIQQRLREQQFLGYSLRCRIGINSGPLVAGSVGAQERLNYTVHGDAVNLAARLEALNKAYGTRILISESTAALLAGETLTFVAETEIRGRAGLVKLYTVASEPAQERRKQTTVVQ